MSYSHYERLSALDNSFLDLEDANVHMHVGAVGIFEDTRLQKPDGGFDMDRVRSLSEWSLRRSPRFRQRLEQIPLLGARVWVDDDHFNLGYHLRHTSLPEPGDERQLKRLTGRIMSQKLDRGKPMWEMWFVEGLEAGRFAIISKIHHCMIDGVSGVDLMASLMGPNPDHQFEPSQAQWRPRPAPSGGRLLSDELMRRAGAPMRALGAIGEALRSPIESARELSTGVEGLREALGGGFSSASPTPLNETIGPHRRFDWSRIDLDAVKEIKSRHGGTVNDVVLATVAGALRRQLSAAGEEVDELDLVAMVPVSIRTTEQQGKLGNRVAFLQVPLPVDEADPKRRLLRIKKTTKELKASSRVKGTEWLEAFSDESRTTGLISWLTRRSVGTRPYNIVVTNVPGPQLPVYLLGCRMVASYPLVPLYANQGVGIALFSYDGGLFWGFNSDWDSSVPLHDLVETVQLEFEALRKA